MLSIPNVETTKFIAETCIEEVKREQALADRRLYLYGAIESVGEESKGLYLDVSMTSWLTECIIEINRKDAEDGIPPEERKPIRLYINSPGGELKEGLALVSAIELSKTPVWTINVGEWCSMAFLIGITGHRRLSMPNMMFLVHEGWTFGGVSIGKVQDRAKFEERLKSEVVREHVLGHSAMSERDYDRLGRVELYMLPDDALEYGFIDEIVTDIDAIF